MKYLSILYAAVAALDVYWAFPIKPISLVFLAFAVYMSYRAYQIYTKNAI